ncbi:MAG: hypothetical protein IJY63_04335 [Clostridia bacterium]|nr:hypothetical protein [Clostridia bacterium]
MNEHERAFVKRIRGDYEEKAQTPLDELIALDKKAKRPALIFGVFAALVMGVGMCLAMKVIFASHVWTMPVGIAVGLVGIGLAALNYYLYRVLQQKGKDKYGETILSISRELIGE